MDNLRISRKLWVTLGEETGESKQEDLVTPGRGDSPGVRDTRPSGLDSQCDRRKEGVETQGTPVPVQGLRSYSDGRLLSWSLSSPRGSGSGSLGRSLLSDQSRCPRGFRVPGRLGRNSVLLTPITWFQGVGVVVFLVTGLTARVVRPGVGPPQSDWDGDVRYTWERKEKRGRGLPTDRDVGFSGRDGSGSVPGLPGPTRPLFCGTSGPTPSVTSGPSSRDTPHLR